MSSSTAVIEFRIYLSVNSIHLLHNLKSLIEITKEIKKSTECPRYFSSRDTPPGYVYGRIKFIFSKRVTVNFCTMRCKSTSLR